MLRSPRRDRFAPQETPERERREAAFASGEQNIPGSVPEGKEGKTEYRKVTPEARTVLEGISAGTHRSAEATLSVEHHEEIYQSTGVLDSIGDIAHPSEHVEGILQAAIERAGIPSRTDESASNSIASWHNEQRAKKTLLDESIAKARAEMLRNITDDPETLIALIRSLEDQRKRYRQFVDNIERDTEDSDQRDGSTKLRMILRAEAAEQIQAMMRRHDWSSVEQWIKETNPAEIRYALDISDAEDSSGVLRRGINLLNDWRKRLTFGMFRWNPSDEEPKDEEKRRMQEQYFTKIEKHITGLKGMLKEKLEARANHLSRRVDTEMRKGLAEAAQKGVGIENISQISASQFDGEIATAFERDHLITLEDAIEETNAVVARIKQSRGLKIHADDFIDRAADALESMDELSEEHCPDVWKYAIGEAQRRHEGVRSWIPDFLERYDAVRPKLEDETTASFIALSTGAKDGVEVRTRLDELAQMLRNPSALDRSELSYVQGTVFRLLPAIEGALARNAHQIFAFTPDELSQEHFDEKLNAVQEKVTSVEQLLNASRMQASDACHMLGITQKLSEQIRSARGQLALVTFSRDQAQAALRELEGTKDKTSNEERVGMEQLLRRTPAQVAVVHKQMEQMEKALRFIETGIPREAKTTTKRCRGYCDFGAHEFFVNPETHRKPPPNGPLDTVDLQRSSDHEFGHLVLDTLTERTNVLMGLFDEQQDVFTAFTVPRLSTNEDAEFLLERAAIAWGMDRAQIERDGDAIHAIGGGQAYYRRKRWEEFLLTYATYRSKVEAFGDDYDLEKDPEFASTEERQLLRLLDAQYLENGRVTPRKDIAEFSKTSKGRKTLAFRDIEDPFAEDANAVDARTHLPERTAKGNEPTVVAGPTLANFKTIRSQIQFIGNYIHTYPEAGTGWLGEVHRDAKENYEKYFLQFDKRIDAHTGQPKPDYLPEEDGQFGEIIREAINRLKVIEKQIKDYDGKNMRDVADAAPVGKAFWLWFTRDIQWLSIMDYWTMATEGWEDIKRLWKRRGENARGKVGELLTSWINDKVPYFGQLKHEFHRRQQDSELAAVQVWEQALENVDSYKLIEDIPHVNNQDHLKAVMILLTKRGRLDWDDEKLWEALSRFSHFKIPRDECHRDPVLLDKWLQKVIADIWTDKDLYRTWKTSNEHSYAQERDKYEGVADYYSNAALLGSQLEYLLETFVHAKENHKPIPDQVNPHLYEKLFLYAMEKGKMTMEAKFFYLIQGLRWKIIPFDRLSILNGKISTDTFPFIDYFYQQNNTEKEIYELAESLKESEDQRFKPGPKTTAFLIEEVAHDEASRSRVTKVIARKGNNIDHEDIPMVTGYMTQGGWNNFLIVATGAVQRVTAEGLKNAYVGYNTLFKVYGMLAEKKAEDGQSLAPSDVTYLAERIVAFAHYDNVVVRQAIDIRDRPKLSLREIENETMPSGNNKKVKEYRDPMNELKFRVFQAYAREMAEILETQGKFVSDENGIEISGANREEKFKNYREMYLGMDDHGNPLSETPFTGGNKKGLRIFKMSGEVETAMVEAVKTDKGKKMIDILRDMTIRENHGRGKLLNEGGDEDQIIYAKHQAIFNRQKRFKRANGEGHPLAS